MITFDHLRKPTRKEIWAFLGLLFVAFWVLIKITVKAFAQLMAAGAKSDPGYYQQDEEWRYRDSEKYTNPSHPEYYIYGDDD